MNTVVTIQIDVDKLIDKVMEARNEFFTKCWYRVEGVPIVLISETLFRTIRHALLSDQGPQTYMVKQNTDRESFRLCGLLFTPTVGLPFVDRFFITGKAAEIRNELAVSVFLNDVCGTFSIEEREDGED